MAGEKKHTPRWRVLSLSFLGTNPKHASKTKKQKKKKKNQTHYGNVLMLFWSTVKIRTHKTERAGKYQWVCMWGSCYVYFCQVGSHGWVVDVITMLQLLVDITATGQLGAAARPQKEGKRQRGRGGEFRSWIRTLKEPSFSFCPCVPFFRSYIPFFLAEFKFGASKRSVKTGWTPRFRSMSDTHKHKFYFVVLFVQLY